MDKIRLDIIAISHSVTQSHNYAIILGESKGVRRLPIVIGGFEAQAIAVAVERMTPNRPLTHDLFKATLDHFNIEIKEVVVNDLIDGIFYAQLICSQDGDVYVIDARTSDAIAMAVRFSCPIYTYESVLEKAGVEMDDQVSPTTNAPGKPAKSKEGLASKSIVELEKMLEQVLEAEDYEQAAKIRDELNNRATN